MSKLIPIETNAFCIPERLCEIDPNIQVFLDTRRQNYVVMTLDDARVAYRLGAWPYLDQRVIQAIRHAYWIARTTGDPYKQLIRGVDDREYREDRELTKATEEMFYRHDNNFRYMGQWQGWRAS
jgi:hypothetical protein